MANHVRSFVSVSFIVLLLSIAGCSSESADHPKKLTPEQTIEKYHTSLNHCDLKGMKKYLFNGSDDHNYKKLKDELDSYKSINPESHKRICSEGISYKKPKKMFIAPFPGQPQTKTYRVFLVDGRSKDEDISYQVMEQKDGIWKIKSDHLNITIGDIDIVKGEAKWKDITIK
ncbi:hypothetical protein [Marininema halotolerans]|uniref:DUF3828 domain-containing protein n=1 Tax=Marininema halotolerans TaxID=1155944 RepID=A0A1I6URE5_9BACL|nr:hypothetical protein [Marininema halotolerans]SFT03980.1 hypothetical protein SAMN05444972_11927 [Marininema halotolerans]